MVENLIAVDSRCESVNPAEAEKLMLIPPAGHPAGFSTRNYKVGGEILPKVEQKQVVVNEIKEKLDKALSVVLVDSRGLTVDQDTALRKLLREAGVDYKVYKNTMMNFAVKDTQFAGLSQYLNGPTAAAFSYREATTAASLINKQLKNMPKLEFKAGVVAGALYDGEGMKLSADIPSREVLLSKLLGSFKSPMAAFARLVNAVAESKASPAAEAPAAPAEA
jgi:large subunit ribosomal protein L10